MGKPSARERASAPPPARAPTTTSLPGVTQVQRVGLALVAEAQHGDRPLGQPVCHPVLLRRRGRPGRGSIRTGRCPSSWRRETRARGARAYFRLAAGLAGAAAGFASFGGGAPQSDFATCLPPWNV